MQKTNIPNTKNKLRELMIEAFIIEFEILNDEEQKQVLPWIESLNVKGLYRFLTQETILELGEVIAGNPTIRQFVLSLSERVQILILTSDELTQNTLVRLIDEIIKVREMYQFGSASIIAKAVAGSLEMSKDNLTKVLNANMWILILYLSLASGAYNLALQLYAEIQQGKS